MGGQTGRSLMGLPDRECSELPDLGFADVGEHKLITEVVHQRPDPPDQRVLGLRFERRDEAGRAESGDGVISVGRLWVRYP